MPRKESLRVTRREYLGHSTGLLLPGRHTPGSHRDKPLLGRRRRPPPAHGGCAATHCSLVPSTEGLKGSSPRPGPGPGPAGRPGRSPATAITAAMPGPHGPEAPRHHREHLREGPRPPLWRLEDCFSLPAAGACGA